MSTHCFPFCFKLQFNFNLICIGFLTIFKTESKDYESKKNYILRKSIDMCI